MKEKLKKVPEIAIIGTGQRAQNLYIPVLQQFPGIKLRGISGKNQNKTKILAEKYGVIAYENNEQLLNDKSVDAVIACVAWTENSSLYQIIARSDKPALLETPLGHNWESINQSFKLLSKRKVYTEVAEQYAMRPLELLKQRLIKKGIFGDVFYAFNDGVGHEYHGLSLIRSYLGFHQRLKKAYALQRDIPYFDHELHKGVFFNGERIQLCLLEFESGAMASHHWSWLNYESPIRNRRLSGFYATRGAAWGEECIAFDDHRNLPDSIRFERRTRVVAGIEILSEMVAHFKGRSIEKWSNPHPEILLNEDQILGLLFIKRLIKGIRNEQEAIYTPLRAFEDHEMVESINKAIKNGAPL